MKSMNQCLELAEISWFYGINGNEADKKYANFYNLLLDYQDAFLFGQKEILIDLKNTIEQLEDNKKFINIIKCLIH